MNIHQAKTRLSRYVKRAKAGETIILCDRNKPVAELRPLSEEVLDLLKAKRPIGFDDGKVQLGDTWDSVDTNREVGDPFDRVMIATAQTMSLPLLSKYRVFAAYDMELIW